MAPSIAAREYIRWLPERESEPTSTLVLTSAENRFVDVRILRHGEGSNVREESEDVLPSSRLDWAFAGTSSSEFRQSQDGKKVVHSTWRHWVDSRVSDTGGVKDEGDMYPQPDGRTLEKGSMVNPSTGKLTDYQEMWRDLDPVATIHEDRDEVKACVVLMLEDNAHKAKGMVVRVGQFCQGVLRIGHRFSLERWDWKGKEEGWKRAVRIGDFWLPCGVATEEGTLKMDGEVKYGEFVWKVVELSHF